MAIRNAIPLGRILGIEVGLDYSWFVIFALITVTFGMELFPQLHPGWPSWWYGSVAVAASLLFFGSILAHELGHSWVAIRTGTPVASITLFLFGGVAGMAREPDRAWHEFLIAIAGPIVSIGLAAAFAGLYGVAPPGTPLATLAQTLAAINAFVAVFNLLPGFPMDGGRILRAALWGGTGDLRRATKIASWVGRGIAYLLMAGGLIRALGFGQWVGGAWLVLIALFIHTVAVRSDRHVTRQQRLRSIRMDDVVEDGLTPLPPEATVAQVLGNALIWGERPAWPVVERDRWIGLVARDELQQVPWDERARTPVGDLLADARRFVVAEATESVAEVLARLDGARFVVVRDGRRLVGVVPRERLTRLLDAPG